ncbi:hypothetical protein OGAPHI_002758 [Ogataea philodendri]|uniref:DUF3844 domain-containing protein n=1 Tax=Ogataea philodendri TaxID=1378263 RepID=A0A9P8T7C0_9ASCO|nr:uncharacterized protein OGAPHI_002758 [Ogataea philodendri]KAH3669003.1 hypothetical protein OGAPHI_002758 [Ogataea philodendri]
MVQLLNSAVLASLAFAYTATAENAAVYRFSVPESNDDIALLSQKDSIYNLADEFGVSDFFKLGSLDDPKSLGLGKSTQLDDQDKSQLVVIINGVDSPKSFFDQIQPTFEIETKDDRSSFEFRNFLSEFPSQLMKLDSDLKLSKLSNQISILGQNIHNVLSETWSRVFHDKEYNSIAEFWRNIVGIYGTSHASRRSLDVINDEQFISELTQLDYLLKNQIQSSEDTIVINLQSLTSIYKKTGPDSQTYKACKNLLSKLISSQLQNAPNYDPTVVVMPLQQQTVTFKLKEDAREGISLAKRDTSNVFTRSTGCFSSQEDCLISTSTCSGHGICSKVGKCWKCLCSPTKDETTGSTTKWTGGACQKKDVSAEANLFLWTTVALFFVFVAGIKLLVSCGNEELPGVLVAATVPTKKTI